jgi:Rod binding domain-containing protein
VATPTVNLPERNSPFTTEIVKDTPAKIRDSARQFEALLIAQILRSVREPSGGWLACGDGQAGSSISDYAEQQLAHVLSASGGLGIASLIEQGLTGKAQPQTDRATASVAPDDPA